MFYSGEVAEALHILTSKNEKEINQKLKNLINKRKKINENSGEENDEEK